MPDSAPTKGLCLPEPIDYHNTQLSGITEQQLQAIFLFQTVMAAIARMSLGQHVALLHHSGNLNFRIYWRSELCHSSQRVTACCTNHAVLSANLEGLGPPRMDRLIRN